MTGPSTKFHALLRSTSRRERHTLELPLDVIKWLASEMPATEENRWRWPQVQFPTTVFGPDEDLVGFQCSGGTLWAWLQRHEHLIEAARFCSFVALHFTKRGMSEIEQVTLVMPTAVHHKERRTGGGRPKTRRNGSNGGSSGPPLRGNLNSKEAVARVTLGLSQWELGRLIGVSGPCINMWEAGQRKPSREALRLAWLKELKLI